MDRDLVYDTMFKALSYFGTLSEELKLAILGVTSIRRFWKNDVIEESGVVCRYCYFSYSGYVKGYKKIDDKYLVQWFMGPGKIIIRPESFHEQKLSNGWIKALDDMITVELSYDNYAWLIENFPDFREIDSKAVLYYYKLAEEREEMKGKTPEVNLEKLMKDNPGILDIAREEDIASYLGIDRKTLFRIRQKL
ncbi:Crp/Fnr family transcriptional regulator [Chitinophaga niabensis]|uniref:Crp/Fnr family transcriptional regulator n=1 Tax=Chitinophaga niabensis TaxID=536979 RepID=UPI0031BB80B3